MIIYEEDNVVLAVLTLGMTLFFESERFDPNAANMLRRAIDIVVPGATWYRAGEMRRNASISAGPINFFDRHVVRPYQQFEECFLFIDSGVTADGVGQSAFKFACVPDSSSEVLGYFQLHIPCDTPGAAARLADLFGSCVESSLFLHGYSGFAINFDHGDQNDDRDVAMRAYCERFLGVSLTDLLTESEQLVTAVKGAQWLTFVGDKLLQREEEQSEIIRSAPDASVTSNGVLLKACSLPRRGDRRGKEDMQPYRHINELLGPWLVDNLWPMPGFPDEEAARSWLHRLRSDP